MATTVTDNAETGRYEIVVNGELAGFTEYHAQGQARAFAHTSIDARFEGRGIGSTLVKAALDDARRSGHDVLPYCPFVRGYLDRHPEYVDLVPAERRTEFGLTS